MKSTLAPECQVHAKHFFALDRRRFEDDRRSTLDYARKRENAHRFSVNRKIKRNNFNFSFPPYTRLVDEYWNRDDSSRAEIRRRKAGLPSVGVLCKNTHTRLFTERVGKLGHGQSRNEWPLERRVSRFTLRQEL